MSDAATRLRLSPTTSTSTPTTPAIRSPQRHCRHRTRSADTCSFSSTGACRRIARRRSAPGPGRSSSMAEASDWSPAQRTAGLSPGFSARFTPGGFASRFRYRQGSAGAPARARRRGSRGGASDNAGDYSAGADGSRHELAASLGRSDAASSPTIGRDSIASGAGELMSNLRLSCLCCGSTRASRAVERRGVS